MKNLFTLTSSIVTLSARSATTSEELAAAVSARLIALAQAHALTIPRTSEAAGRNEQATTLRTLIQTIVAPYGGVDRSQSRVVVTGPDIAIAGGAVTSFALLREFATNAAKYGALSVQEGRVDISCVDDGDHFVLTWNGSGGPPVDRQTDGEGFGTLLAKATVRGQLAGAISRDWKPEGLSIRLMVARDNLSVQRSED